MAAKSIAYSSTGDVLAKIFCNEKFKNDISRYDVFLLLIGYSVGDLSISKQIRVKIMYRYSDDYAAWVLASMLSISNCNINKLKAIKNIAFERKINNDNRIIQAFNACK